MNPSTDQCDVWKEEEKKEDEEAPPNQEQYWMDQGIDPRDPRSFDTEAMQMQMCR